MPSQSKQHSKRIAPVSTFAGLGISIVVHSVIFLFVGSVVIFEGKVPAVPFLGGMEDSAGIQMEDEMPLLEEEEPIQMETSLPESELAPPTEVTDSTELASSMDLISSATANAAFTMPTGVGGPTINTNALLSRSTGRKVPGGPGGTGGARSINFFGAKATGTNFAILMDLTMSGAEVFEKTRDELLKTLETVEKGNANFMLIYFGGKDAGHIGRIDMGAQKGKDFTESDFWFPRGISGKNWLEGSGSEIDKIVDELNAVTPKDKSSWTGSYNEKDKGGIFFRLGTQYWGALNAAFELRPAPSTVFLLVEPKIGLPNEQTVQANWEWYKKHGKSKPEGTEVHLIIGQPKEKTDVAAAELMVDLLNGGNLSNSEKKKLITYVSL